ncbi:MAG: YhcH/YjgK/YiaL family protein [Rikenellaceae bacterium]
MIVDTLKNAHLYYSIAPRMQQAFELLATTPLEELSEGKHQLAGDDIFVNIMDRDLKVPSDAKLEIHNEYADIQILLVGDKEGFGWTPRHELSLPINEFDAQKDIQLFDDAHQTTYYITKGQFTILLPEDGHAPMIGEGAVRKAIVKIRL